jgi:hypothetical protein
MGNQARFSAGKIRNYFEIEKERKKKKGSPRMVVDGGAAPPFSRSLPVVRPPAVVQPRLGWR